MGRKENDAGKAKAKRAKHLQVRYGMALSSSSQNLEIWMLWDWTAAPLMDIRCSAAWSMHSLRYWGYKVARTLNV